MLSLTHRCLRNLTSMQSGSPSSLSFSGSITSDLFCQFLPPKARICFCAVSGWITATLNWSISLTAHVTSFRRLGELPFIVLRSRKAEHVTRTGCQAPARFDYKMATLCYRCLHGLALAHLSQLLTPYHLSRSLRSAVPRFRHSADAPPPTFVPPFEVLCPVLLKVQPQKLNPSL